LTFGSGRVVDLSFLLGLIRTLPLDGNKFIEAFTAELTLCAKRCEKLHEKSMSLLDMLLKPNSTKVDHAFKLFTELNNEISPPVLSETVYHIIFCLDDSGSMSGKPWQELTFAVKAFVERRLKESNEDVVTIINYNSIASIKVEKLPITEDYSEYLVFGGGGTLFSAGLQMCIKVLSTTDFSTYTPLVLFLSDGGAADGDPEASKIKTDYAAKKLEFISLGFGVRAKTSRLKRIAELAGGKFLQSNNNVELSTNFVEISSQMGRARQI